MTQPSEEAIRKACEEAGVSYYAPDENGPWEWSKALLALARRIERQMCNRRGEDQCGCSLCVILADTAAEIRSLREQVAQERVFRGALMTIATGGFKSDKCRQIAREALAFERHEDKEKRA